MSEKMFSKPIHFTRIRHFTFVAGIIVTGQLALAQGLLAENFEVLSDARNYRLKFASLSEKTTGTISLIDEGTSAVLAEIEVQPGKMRSEPKAVWREASADVAVGLDTHNACSPAYIFFYAKNKGYVAVAHGELERLSGFLGIDPKQIIRARYTPVSWMETSLEGGQICVMQEQCWDKNQQRFTRGETVLINADGMVLGR